MRYLAVISIIMAVASMLGSCSNDDRPYRQGVIDPELTPTMTTLRANTTISDSGYQRYRILAPTWLMFDNAKEPRWTFPDGMHMERYDNYGRVNSTIDCDSATYFTATQTWRLDGAVDISDGDGQRFLTQQLWWNRLGREVYSDSFIHIEQPGRVIEGFGFKSDDQMTNYVVLRPSGIFPASQFDPGARDDAADTDAPFDPDAAAAADPLDAQRTDSAFNGTPTDTMFVSTSASQRPRRRAARNTLRRRTPYAAQQADTAAASVISTSEPEETGPRIPSPLERSRRTAADSTDNRKRRVPARRVRAIEVADTLQTTSRQQ